MNLTSPDGWEKHIQRFAASSVVAIACEFWSRPPESGIEPNFPRITDGRRVDDVNVGFVQSVIQRMEEVGRTK